MLVTFRFRGEARSVRLRGSLESVGDTVYPAGLEFTGDDEVVGSLLELPDARPWRWSAERDVPHGEVVEREIDGRRVWLYTPVRAARRCFFSSTGMRTRRSRRRRWCSTTWWPTS